MIVGLTVTPALGMMLLGKGTESVGESPVSVWLGKLFEVVIKKVVTAPRTVFVVSLIVIVGGFLVWPFLGQSLLPSLKERTLLVKWTTPPGTSNDETYRITSRVSRELQSLPGVRNVGAHIGRAITGDQIVGVNSGQIWVDIDPDAKYDEVRSAIRETIDGYPGIDRNLQAYLRDTVSEALTGESAPIVVRIYGPRRRILHRKAEEVREVLSGISGLVDLRTVGQVEEPQVKVKVNLEAAGRASVKPGDVRRSAATVFSGLTVGYLFEEQKIYDVVVWGAPETRQSLNDIRDLLVEKTDRHHVRLGDVADVSIVPTPTVIRHENIAPYVDVIANVVGRDLRSVNREIENRLGKVDFPLEYHPEILGEYAERQEAQKRIMAVAAAALIGIFLLLQACFQSWRLAMIGFLSLPAAIAGGVLAVLIFGGVMSLGSIIGFLAVLGIAARNGILLINNYQCLQEQEGVPGVRERLTPILASSSVIVAALLPIFILGRIPGLEIIQPTAIVIVGGLVASTLFTLFVMPALYLVIGSGTDRQSDLGLTGV
jgi:Cu/Ag efflux pump CusA